ncbi:hypothetical protein DL93DRAFT_185859 [Clavulina sp. PMI_390]|nr:hypothetical protein DL93DRAFT_185859 [Clavulina sp. PMI_390]
MAVAFPLLFAITTSLSVSSCYSDYATAQLDYSCYLNEHHVGLSLSNEVLVDAVLVSKGLKHFIMAVVGLLHSSCFHVPSSAAFLHAQSLLLFSTARIAVICGAVIWSSVLTTRDMVLRL